MVEASRGAYSYVLRQIAAGGGEQVGTGRADEAIHAFEGLAGNTVVREEVPVHVYVDEDHRPVVQAGTGCGGE